MTTYHREKYQQALLYFMSQGIQYLGKVKMMKLVYYVDFDHFYQYGTSITGDSYKHLPLGPVPTAAQDMLMELEHQGKITIEQQDIGYNNPLTHYHANVNPDLGVFSPIERAQLERVAQKWRYQTTKEIVAASHEDPPWRDTQDKEIIPYELVLKRSEYTEEEMEDWTEEDRKNYQQLLRATADFTDEMNLKGTLYQEILDAYQDIENGNGLIEYVALDA